MVHRLLGLGVLLPFVYLGIQLVAAPFHPGYSFLSRDASALGSGESAAPWVFNVGVLVLGLVKIAVAAALLRTLPRAGVGPALSGILALALASAGVGSLNAFLHPLPDPRHSEGTLSLLGSGFVLLPVLTAAVLWRIGARRYAVVSVLACLALIPVMTGLVQRACMQAGAECPAFQAFLNGYHGLIQRAGALVVFAPVALIAHRLRTRIGGPDARGAVVVRPVQAR